jgi:diketogulonate reductase-like aldo/keto reductase
VPREYLAVDDTAIKAAIKAGIRSIPGVEIYEEAEVRVRRVG